MFILIIIVLFLLENQFTCMEDVSSKEEIAIDIQLANLIEKQYNGRNVMIWTHGHLFNHIGFFTSLHFKSEQKEIAEFARWYPHLPDQFCDEPG